MGRIDGMVRKATNVTVRQDLLVAARASRINLSAVLERALTAELREAKRREWREQNAKAIEAYNAHLAGHGVFSDGSRSF